MAADATSKSGRPPWWRYAVVPLAVAAALALRGLFWPVLEAELPFLFLWPAVMVAAWHGGFGPGLAATLLAALAESYLVFRPRFSLFVEEPAEAVGLALFVLLGAVVSYRTELLHRARRALQEADRNKDQFLGVLAHELRGPLAAVSNAAHALGLMADRELSLGPLGDVITRQTRQMARLVEDLLDVARVAQGKVRLRKLRCQQRPRPSPARAPPSRRAAATRQPGGSTPCRARRTPGRDHSRRRPQAGRASEPRFRSDSPVEPAPALTAGRTLSPACAGDRTGSSAASPTRRGRRPTPPP